MEMLLPIFGIIVISSITPGPNNLLLATVGMRFGFRAAIPQIIGIQSGMFFLLVLCALGLNQLITREPATLLVLKLFGSGYLVWLAWKIMGIRLSSHQEGRARPLTITQSFMFQFANPKAWMMTTSWIGVALPLTASMPKAVLILFLGFITLGLACNFGWAMTGAALKSVYENNSHRIMINACLAGLTVATVFWFWLS